MEVASYTRNNLPEPDEDSWMYNFELYLQAAKNHSWDTSALKVWFHGGSFLEYWRGCYPVVTTGPRACNLTDNARKRYLYDQIYWMIKGSWPLPPTDLAPRVVTSSPPARGSIIATCVNASDCTEELQAAFSSGAAHVHVPKLDGGRPWLVRPLRLANVSGMHISLAAGVTVLAKQDEFHGLDDCLLRFTNVSDVVLSGAPGSALRMRRDDYAVPSRSTCPNCRPYRKAEWRMGIWLDASAVNVRLENLHVTDSGGDGLFVYGAQNVTVQDCIFERHYRQGMSIISADGLTVERTIFAYTNGTAPSAGIDIEPDRASNELKNIILRDLLLLNNTGGGFMINAGELNRSSNDIAIDVMNITIDGSAGVGIGIGNVVGVGGQITVTATRIMKTIGCGLAVYRKDVNAAALVLNDVNFSRVALGAADSGRTGCAPQGPCSPITVMGGWDPPYTVDVGGFSVCGVIEDAVARPFLIATDPGYELVDAKFNLDVHNLHGCRSNVQKNSSKVDVAVTCHRRSTSTLAYGRTNHLEADQAAVCSQPEH
eukprot:COSAG02_NODE_1857_length_10645_cov_24.485302_8_plen_541_part_00